MDLPKLMRVHPKLIWNVCIHNICAAASHVTARLFSNEAKCFRNKQLNLKILVSFRNTLKQSQEI